MNMKLEDLFQKMDQVDGHWVKCEDRQPPKYGYYYVIKRGRSRHLDYGTYLWNGGSWVTHGHSLSNAVEAWYETEVTGDG